MKLGQLSFNSGYTLICNVIARYSDTDWTIKGVQWAMCPTPVGSSSGANCSKGADIVSCSWGEDDDHSPYLEQYVAAWLKAGMVYI